MDNTNTVMYAECIRNMCNMGISMIRDLDPRDDLAFIRVGTKKLELLAHMGKIRHFRNMHFHNSDCK